MFENNEETMPSICEVSSEAAAGPLDLDFFEPYGVALITQTHAE
jgi:hypothetical protein